MCNYGKILKIKESTVIELIKFQNSSILDFLMFNLTLRRVQEIPKIIGEKRL